MPYKSILSAIAIAITLAAFLPYIRSILAGATKPHVFTWIIWGITAFIIFLAQLAGGGGVGAWAIGVSSVIVFYVAWLAYRRKADIHITRVDWGFFVAALSSIPLWYATSDPLWAVVVLTAINLLGFAPTVRKAYLRPNEEQLLFFATMALRNLLVCLALERFTLTTALFPVTVTIAPTLFVGMVLYRRQLVANAGSALPEPAPRNNPRSELGPGNPPPKGS